MKDIFNLTLGKSILFNRDLRFSCFKDLTNRKLTSTSVLFKNQNTDINVNNENELKFTLDRHNSETIEAFKDNIDLHVTEDLTYGILINFKRVDSFVRKTRKMFRSMYRNDKEGLEDIVRDLVSEAYGPNTYNTYKQILSYKNKIDKQRK